MPPGAPEASGRHWMSGRARRATQPVFAPPAAAPQPAIRALQSALAAEHAAVYGYGVAGAYLTGTSRVPATADWVAHPDARDDLDASPRSRGAPPAPPARAHRRPRPRLPL